MVVGHGETRAHATGRCGSGCSGAVGGIGIGGGGGGGSGGGGGAGGLAYLKAGQRGAQQSGPKQNFNQNGLKEALVL